MKSSGLALIVAVSSALVACGGGGGSSSPTPPPASSSVTSSSVSSIVSSSSLSSESSSSSVPAPSSSSSSSTGLGACEKYNDVQGFAALNDGTTGGSDLGAGNNIVSATSGAQIKSALTNSNYAALPLTIYVDGPITWENSNNGAIQIRRKNVSIIGRNNAEFSGVGIEISHGAGNVIIRNLKMHEYPQSRGAGDLISFDGRNGAVRNVWIDHNELYNSRTAPPGAVCPSTDSNCDLNKDYYDELVSGRGDVSNITISYNHLHDSWKTSLWGSSDDAAQEDFDRRITFHHNHWQNVGSRLPLFRFGEAHIFNNYYQNVSESGINSRMGAVMRIDGNYFESVRNPIVSIDSAELGFWTVADNIFQSITHSNGSCTSGSPPCYRAHEQSTTEGHTPPYAYDLMPAAEVKAYVSAQAGVNKINSCLGFADTGSSSSSSSSSSVAAGGPSAWNIYNGNLLPGAPGSVTLANGGIAEFIIGGNEEGIAHPAFNAAGGLVTFDTSAATGLTHHATIRDVVNSSGVYPKHFTLLAGLTANSDSLRGIEIEIAMADAGQTGSRLKAIMRADGNTNHGVQLEWENSPDSVASYQTPGSPIDMNIFRVYHITVTLTDATTGSVNVYADGSDTPMPNLSLTDVVMRPATGTGSNYVRIGDGGSSAYKSSLDWLIWTDEGVYTPAQLKGLLPAGLGALGGYEAN